MKAKQLIACLGVLFSVSSLLADQAYANALQEKREQVAKQYISDLQQADYKDIANLFEKDGVVVSTSHGKMNAKEFFYSFLPTINSAHIALHQTFKPGSDSNRLAARFHYTYQLKNGEKGEGEYMDEFIFQPDSSKLLAVYMFENLHFI